MDVEQTNSSQGVGAYQENPSKDLGGFIICGLEDIVFSHIFRRLEADLPAMTQVCKQWKKRVYRFLPSKMIYKQIPPGIVIGPKNWKNIGVDAGRADPIPRCVYTDFKSGSHLLTWIPKTIKVIAKDRSRGKKLVLTVKLVEKLVSKAKQGYKIGFDPRAWEKAINEKRTTEKSRWVWLDMDAKWRETGYFKQESNVRDLGRGADVARFSDLCISLLMKFNMSKERCFVLDPPTADGMRTLICTGDRTKGMLICVGFAPDGLHVQRCYEGADNFVAVVVARKSIGT